MTHDINYYLDYLSPQFLERLNQMGEAVPGVPGLKVAPGLQTNSLTLKNQKLWLWHARSMTP